MELCPVPSGFSLRIYLSNILEIFEQAFKQDQYPVFKTIVFAPTYDFEQNNQSFGRKIETPACILDLYELKQAADTATNSGNLYINLCMRALILLENNKRDTHTFIRQYAIDIAGLVTSINLVNVNLPQVKGCKEVKEIREANNFLIGWEVLWEHAVEISPPDYSDIALRNIPAADAIYDVANNRGRFLQDPNNPDDDFITEELSDPISKLSQEVKELQRQVSEIIRLAQVTEVDVENARLTCESEDLIQSDIPFFTFRAGEDQTYWLPSVGELGYLLSPSGNTGNAVFLPGIFYDTFPPADMSATKAKRIFRDELEEEIDTEAHSWKLSTGESNRFVDQEKVEDKHGTSINKIDGSEKTKFSRDAGSIKIDGSQIKMERVAGAIVEAVGSNMNELSLILANIVGAHLYPTGLTTLITPVGNAFFAPTPSPPSAPSPPAGSSPDADGNATQTPPSDVDGITVKSTSRIQFTVPSLPVTTVITGVAGPYPVVATGAGNTTPTPINVTISGTLNVQFPSRGL